MSSPLCSCEAPSPQAITLGSCASSAEIPSLAPTRLLSSHLALKNTKELYIS